jgi:hypothetical protein
MVGYADSMGDTCIRNAYAMSVGELEERTCLEELSVNCRIILERILNAYHIYLA